MWKQKLKLLAVLAGTVLLSNFCLYSSVYAQSVVDEGKISALIAELTGNAKIDKNVRAQLKLLVTQHRQLNASSRSSLQGDSSSRALKIGNATGQAPLPLTEGEWQGELEAFVMDHTDEHGNLTSSDINYHLLTAESSYTVFFLGDALSGHEEAKHIKVKGLMSHHRLVVDQVIGSSVNDSVGQQDKLAASDNVLAAGDVTVAVSDDTLGCDSVGPQRSLVIAVNYQNDTTASPATNVIDGYYYGATNSLADFWSEASHGKISLSGDTLGWYTLDINSDQACNSSLVRAKALEQAAVDTDLTQYNRIFIVMRNPSPGCGWAGLGTLSCPSINTPDGRIQASTHWVLSSYFNNVNSALFLAAHEGGHNIKLHHAAVRDYGVDATGPIGSTGGSLVEYGDRYDVMGTPGRPNHYNADHKYSIGWLEDADIIQANGDVTTTLEPISTPLTGIKAVKLYRGVDPNNFGKEYFWLETRKQLGYDSNMDARGVDGIHVHLQRYRRFQSSVKTEAIDTHPGTDTGTNDYFDVPVYAGETFTDPYSGINITHQGVDGNGNVQLSVSTPTDNLDVDEDGLFLITETNYGTNPNLADTDGDGLTDFQEVCYDKDCNNYTPAPSGGDLDANNPDTDGDGMQDGWEVTNGTDPLVNDAALDPDQDGLSNLEEYNANTNPNQSDTDQDGLSDRDEVKLYGSNPNNSDTDGDGMQDGWEVANGLNLLDANDASSDNDKDGLDNITEFQLGTDPNNTDTDGDGLSDSDEINIYATSPLQSDTDSDGVNDGEEVANNTDPLLRADRDLDGMSDDWETIRGTRVSSDDARVDADGDGVDNIIEFARNTLPLDVTSVPPVQIWYVDSVNGDDAAGDGSAANPYANIPAALAVARAGDTLRLATGSYGSGTFFFLSKMVSIEGPADRSATVSLPSLYIYGPSWGGFSGVKLNTGSFFYLQSGRNLIFSNVELSMAGTLRMAANTKLLLDHVLVTNNGPAAVAVVATDVINGFNQTNLELSNTTLAGFALGIDWNQGQFLRIRNSILANTVDLQDAWAYQIWNSLISDSQFISFGNNLGGDPLFVDVMAGDYHLLANSPAVDTASPYDSAGAEPNSVRLNMGFYGGTSEAVQAQDNDGDGLPDGWEAVVGLNPADPLDRLADTDGDGINNTLEYRTGTSPNLASSRRGLGYWLLNPNQLNSSIEVMALVDASYFFGPGYVRLDQFQTASVETTNLTIGQRIYSNQALSIANAADGTDMLVPDWFAGHAFVLPHVRNAHRYHLFSPYGEAQVRINVSGSEQMVTVPRNEVVVFEAGSDNTRSGLVHSDRPIMITHTAYTGNQTRDVYAVPPVAKDISGVYSRFVYIGALEDNTQITVVDSNGVSTAYVLHAGGRRLLSGGGVSQGRGLALRIRADKPIAALQAADSDGIEATAFWDPIYSGRRYGLPIDTQYAAVVCQQTSDIVLYDIGGVVLAAQSCTPGASGQPGKAYFGAASNGVNIPAGAYLIGSEPFYMMFEASGSNDEKNILGHL